MSSLTLPNYSAFLQSPQLYITNTSKKKNVNDSSIWGTKLCLMNGGSISLGVARKRCHFRVNAMSTSSSLKMNLNEYMVTLEKPLGIRFALSVDGTVFVHSLKKGVRFLSLLSPFHFIATLLLYCNSVSKAHTPIHTYVK